LTINSKKEIIFHMVEKKANAPGFINFELEQSAMPEETKGNKDAPAEWEIEHAYGYRTADCQQNL